MVHLFSSTLNIYAVVETQNFLCTQYYSKKKSNSERRTFGPFIFYKLLFPVFHKNGINAGLCVEMKDEVQYSIIVSFLPWE